MDESLPQWDLTPVFPSLDSAEFRREFDETREGIRELARLFELHDVGRRETGGVDAAFAAAYEEATDAFNALLRRVRTLSSYIGCHVTTDARDDLARSLDSELDTAMVLLDQLHTRYVAWVGSSDIDSLLSLSRTAREHEFSLRKARIQAEHQMPPGEEDLSAALRPMGLGAWASLHGNMTALLTAAVPARDPEALLPMSAIRALASDPDRDVRRSAFEAELQAWEGVAQPLAAALNSIKGFQQVIRSRRGWQDDVAPTLLANSIDAEALAAMQEAVQESFPDFQRYFAAKARALGLERLAWFDLLAPLGQSGKTWSWEDAESFVVTNFGRYSEELARFAEEAFRKRWVDAGPRVGKEGGAYCTNILPGESRIMMNFDHRFDGVSTLAHELGHAYHNLNLRDRTPLQQGTPATLAETASIFCETLAVEAALENAERSERLSLIDSALQRDLLVVVDIHSRFLFEKAVFERRTERELTVPELNDLMLSAQRQTYGDALERLHPFMWAVKGHYYGPTFYNYPYTFGLLFGIGLYARYQQDPDGFRAAYDRLLSETGMADAATLARRFGVDIRTPGFWRSALDVCRARILELERLI